VPARKSTAAVSRSVGPGTVRLGALAIDALPTRSAEVMRRKYVVFDVRPVSCIE
jgi:hypothetical protein